MSSYDSYDEADSDRSLESEDFSGENPAVPGEDWTPPGTAVVTPMPTATQPVFQPPTKGSDPYDNPANSDRSLESEDFSGENPAVPGEDWTPPGTAVVTPMPTATQPVFQPPTKGSDPYDNPRQISHQQMKGVGSRQSAILRGQSKPVNSAGSWTLDPKQLILLDIIVTGVAPLTFGATGGRPGRPALPPALPVVTPIPTATQPGFQPPTNGSDPYDSPRNPEDTGDVKGSDFTDQNNRRGFIRKVYSILMVQLLITFGFVTLFCFHEPTIMFLYSTFILFNMPGLFIIAIVVVLVVMISLACWGEFIRKAPANYVMLFIFTIAEGVLVGVLTSMYASYAVWMAVGITAVVCLALTLFTFQTKYDFTTRRGILLVAVIILLLSASVASLLHSLITRKTYNTLLSVLTVNLIYASLGALVFSVYLIYDTQLMMGGKHKYSISPEEYVFAALNLYLDIIYIFPNLFIRSSKNTKKT